MLVALIVEILYHDPSKNIPITQTKFWFSFDMLNFFYLILMLDIDVEDPYIGYDFHDI